MKRSDVIISLLIALSATKFGIAASTVGYNLITDGRGAPKLAIKGSNLPAVGHFWLHFPGTDHGNGRQLSAASVDVSGVVKACIIDLNGTNFNFSDWHFIKWILKNNEFTCALIGSDRAKNLTSPPVALPISNNASTKNGLTYTISPGAGNSDFCLYNVTVGSTRVVVDCVRVRKTSPTVSPNNNGDQPTCDCPARPSAMLDRHIFDQSQDEEAEAERLDLRGNSVTAADDREKWNNNSLWLIEFPTPKPFGTPTTVGGSSMGRNVTVTIAGNVTGTTKTVIRVLAGGGNGTSTPKNASSTVRTTATISTTTPKSASNSCRAECQNGGVCVENATAVDHYFCNCTPAYRGNFCQIAGIESRPSTDEIECPSDYCHNGGACKTTRVGANDSVQMPNFTCFCLEGYVGQFCSHSNFCYWENPCQNGGSCSISVPLTEGDWATATNETLYRCQCRAGFEGDRCQMEAARSTTPVTAAVPNGTLDETAQCQRGEAELCKNGAECKMLDQKPVCYCATNFTGDHCEKRVIDATTTPGASSRSAGAIVGGVFGGLAFVGLIIGSIFLYRYIQRSRKLRGKYNPAKEEMTAGGGNTMTMTTAPTGERLI